MPAQFTLSAEPGTDVWKKPPQNLHWNAPTKQPSSVTHTGPLTAFKSARLSVQVPWSEQYDQAGLILGFRKTTLTLAARAPARWIKTGVEFYNGVPYVSTVGTDNFSDWSVTPHPAGEKADGKSVWTTISIENETGPNGPSLWIYLIREDGKKQPLREITWCFGHDSDTWKVGVAAYVARPSKNGGNLEAEFKDLEFKWADFKPDISYDETTQPE